MSAHSWRLQVEPRAWQTAALQAWTENDRRGVASVVTGGGKTVFAEMCMASLRDTNPAALFIIVVPTLALLDQWFVSLTEELSVSSADIATYSGEGLPEKPALVNLMVLNTARDHVELVASGREVMLVVDECHRAGSPENARALRAATAVGTLGISATPVREYDDAFEQVIVPALGPIIYSYDYNDAAREHVVAPFELTNVAVPFTPSEQAEYVGLTRRVGRALREFKETGDDARLKRLLQQRAAVASGASYRVPGAVALAEQNRGMRTLIFHEQIRAAEAIKELLQKRGHNAATYHSKVGPILRRDNLRMFRRGRFDVLVSCRALDEGVNLPETTLAIIASSTASQRQRIQRLGRVLRPAPGKDLASVYTLYVTEVEEKRLRAEAEQLAGSARIHWQRIERVSGD